MEMKEMYESMGICSQVLEFGLNIEKKLKDRFEAIDETAE